MGRICMYKHGSRMSINLMAVRALKDKREKHYDS